MRFWNFIRTHEADRFVVGYFWIHFICNYSNEEKVPLAMFWRWCQLNKIFAFRELIKPI